jgi:hypothetical protein
MANNIANHLIITANSNEELTNFLSFIQHDEIIDGEVSVIDFNKILPRPKELDDTEESSTTDLCIYYYLITDNKEHLISSVISNRSFSKEKILKISKDRLNEMFKIGKKYFENYIKYGATTWYQWCISNWGSKWNAYDSYIVEKGDCCAAIRFFTAWSGVPNIINKLTEMFPTFTFEYKYADEDMGYNCGECYGNNGEFSFNTFVDGSDEAMETYIYCWDYDIEDFYKDENGVWHNILFEE